MHLNEWRYQRKLLWPLLLRIRGGRKLLERISLQKKRPIKEKSKAPKKSKNGVQPEVKEHHSNAYVPQSSSQASYTNGTRASKIPDNLVLGNHEVSNGIEEFFINYTSSEKNI
jgi:hypothetical protein